MTYPDISYYLNQVIMGQELSQGIYTMLLPDDQTAEQKIPFAMSGMVLSETTAIGMDTGKLSPADFYRNNQSKQFMLDAKKKPTKISTSVGEKVIFYLSEYSEFRSDSNVKDRFIINCFKENRQTFAMPLIKSMSPAMLDIVVWEIQDKLKEIRENPSEATTVDLEQKDFGAFCMQVDFLQNPDGDPDGFNATYFSSSGFTRDEIMTVLRSVIKQLRSQV